MASNPRIDDLRKRIDKDPGSRLFAQLAEELRKDGELEEAIRVSREGLHKHPAYPSARMTLGRALLDTGDVAAARTEFELVLKGAPDNILASRFLGECLEALGDLVAARDRFKATLALAPGDKVVTAHLHDVEAKLKKAPAAGAPGAAPGAGRAPEEPAAPIPLSRVDEPMELERTEAPTVALRPDRVRSPESTVMIPATTALSPPPAAASPIAAPPATDAAEPPPIPLVAAEEDFELERAYEAPGPAPLPPEAGSPAVPSVPPAPGGGFESSGPAAEFEFDVAPAGGMSAPEPEPWRPAPPAATVRMAEPMVEPPAEPPLPPPPRPVAPSRPPAPAAPPLPPPVFAAAPPPARVEAPPRPPPPRVEALPPPSPPEAVPAPAPAPAPAEADDLTSSTLAELYFNQGFTDKAIEVYRQLLQREPGNERGRTRLADLEALERRLNEEESRAAPPAGGGPADAAAARRRAIERTIARLEGLLAALRKE